MPDHQPGHPDNVGLPLPEPPDSSLPPHLGPSHMISKHTSPAFAYMFGYIVAVVQAVLAAMFVLESVRNLRL